MKGGGRIALGVGIGYLLGRTRKMRFAMSLAGAAMARRSAGTPGGLLERGTELLRSTPELTRITDTVRDELVGAVRSAAVTAASNRIDALSNRLQQGTTLLADQGREGSRATDSDEDEYEDESSEYDEGGREDEEQTPDNELEDDYEDDQDRMADNELEDEDEDDQDRTPDNELEDEDEEQTPDDEEDADQGAAEDDTERPAARTRSRRSSTAARRAASSRSADRSSDSADRKPSGTGGRRSRAEAGQAPVRRTRR
ncbi:hypothetical protein [Nocardia niwae]|uniref:hypothetical protein n=1 Tax=Nocardia niwae TaxID=626084 RepID=UPI0007C766CF|nr:hypothetical protein [Nocardia niwae]